MKKYNHICLKCKTTAKFRLGACCPKCRDIMTCIGDRWRIGRNGNFDKIEGQAKKAKLVVNRYFIK